MARVGVNDRSAQGGQEQKQVQGQEQEQVREQEQEQEQDGRAGHRFLWQCTAEAVG